MNKYKVSDVYAIELLRSQIIGLKLFLYDHNINQNLLTVQVLFKYNFSSENRRSNLIEFLPISVRRPLVVFNSSSAKMYLKGF